MNENISDAVRDVCLGCFDVSEVISQGNPNFRVANKTFAIYQLNHHGDGRIALWRNVRPARRSLRRGKSNLLRRAPTSAPAAGSACASTELDWQIISQRIHEAYANVAPARCSQTSQNRSLSNRPANIDPAVLFRRQSLQRFRH